MLYASVSGISSWVKSGGEFTTRAAQALPEVDVTGNCGTGLEVGAWSVGGGLYWGAIQIDGGFGLDFDVLSISDDDFVFNALESSRVNNSNLPAGGYTNLRATYQTVSLGWFDTREGYLYEGTLCTVQPLCLSKVFVERNQAKVMMYASILGITAWGSSGGEFTTRAAQALPEVDVTGNRGTGLEVGAWSVGGGLFWGAIEIDGGFHLDFDVLSISDDDFVFSALESSRVNNSNLPAGGYPNLRATYQTVSLGWFDTREGYLYEGTLCTVAPLCLSKVFIESNQAKVMMYASILGITAWGSSS